MTKFMIVPYNRAYTECRILAVDMTINFIHIIKKFRTFDLQISYELSKQFLSVEDFLLQAIYLVGQIANLALTIILQRPQLREPCPHSIRQFLVVVSAILVISKGNFLTDCPDEIRAFGVAGLKI